MKINPKAELTYTTTQINKLKAQIRNTTNNPHKTNWIADLMKLQTKRIQLKRISKIVLPLVIFIAFWNWIKK